MFGGGKKEEKPDPALQAQINKERADLQRLQATEGVDKSIQQFEAKIEAKNHEIAILEGVRISSLIERTLLDDVTMIPVVLRFLIC